MKNEKWYDEGCLKKKKEGLSHELTRIIFSLVAKSRGDGEKGRRGEFFIHDYPVKMNTEYEPVCLKSPLHLLMQMFPRGVASKMTGPFLKIVILLISVNLVICGQKILISVNRVISG
ncbi:hypothetical protein JEZ13_12450 [bacterium]|nr:hypothetical protein [bacterium]